MIQKIDNQEESLTIILKKRKGACNQAKLKFY